MDVKEGITGLRKKGRIKDDEWIERAVARSRIVGI